MPLFFCLVLRSVREDLTKIVLEFQYWQMESNFQKQQIILTRDNNFYKSLLVIKNSKIENQQVQDRSFFCLVF